MILRKFLISFLTCFSFTLIIAGREIHYSRYANQEGIESKKTKADSISEAIDYQLITYPSSQYRDIYKNFMQDFFGPGHILNDTTVSGKYLRQELNETETFGGPIYEPTGYKGNYYRVNLSLIKEGIIPYDIFFRNFVESVQNITLPSDEDWKKIWNEIDSVIVAKRLTFIHEEDDRETLQNQFDKGDFVVHHSQDYNNSVNFHYRIISRNNFEKHLLPLIVKGLKK